MKRLFYKDVFKNESDPRSCITHAKTRLQVKPVCTACAAFHPSYSGAPSFQKYPLNNIHNLRLQKCFCLVVTTVIALWKINAKVVPIQRRGWGWRWCGEMFGTRLWCRGTDMLGDRYKIITIFGVKNLFLPTERIPNYTFVFCFVFFYSLSSHLDKPGVSSNTSGFNSHRHQGRRCVGTRLEEHPPSEESPRLQGMQSRRANFKNGYGACKT